MAPLESSRDESEEHFAALIARIEGRPGRRIPLADWRGLAHLYRIHSGRLARLQTRARDSDALRKLNALCLRAYTLLYAAPKRRGRRGDFLLASLPATLGATWSVQTATAGLLLAACVVGGILAGQSPRAAAAIVPAGMYPSDAIERLATSADARAAFLARDETSAAQNALFSSFLFVNNTRVGLMGFALGVLAGVPTLLLVVYNGLTIGAFAAPFLSDPETFWPFLAWIVPHAIPELLAIVLCSSGGVLMGLAVVAPGRRGRIPALRYAAVQALHLVLASIPLVLAAALIESFVRESTLSSGARFTVAFLALSSIGGYVLMVRALARRQPPVDVSFLTSRLGSPASAPLSAPPARGLREARLDGSPDSG